jgi:Fur family transcriptional regulator, ferric uptake regulator
MTGQRRIILRVLSESKDHPDADLVFRRAAKIDPRISISTVYRTVHMLEKAEILESHDFGGQRLRYEQPPDEHHDHLIVEGTGKIIEFSNPQQRRVALELGYRLIGHRLQLFGVPLRNAPAPRTRRARRTSNSARKKSR